jgi:glycosyltransferase involved in cell wall biosynthesis
MPPKLPKLSIITVSYNSAGTIGHAIRSVLEQDYANLEYIIIDGNSTDGTQQIVAQHLPPAASSPVVKFVSEPDAGIYDAMNKGIRMATGEVVGMLNADDFYPHTCVLTEVMRAFDDEQVDAVFGNVVFVPPKALEKVVRKYSSNGWHPGKFAWGYMPAHPSFFVRRKFYEQFGLFKTDYQIAADYELLIRFLYVHRLRYRYLPSTIVTMRTGGASTRNWKSNIILNSEIIRGCRENGIRTNHLMVYSKYFRKVFEMLPH